MFVYFVEIMWKLFLGLLAVVHLCSAHITKEEFTKCVTECGYRPPNPDIYEHFQKATVNFSREELGNINYNISL